MLIEIKNKQVINKERYFEYMMNVPDGLYEIKPYKSTRSNDQNRYYWGLLSIVEKETGISSEESHEKMRMKFLYVPESGTQLAYCRSTAKLNTKDFGEYIENVRNFMAQFGIMLPDADKFNNI